MRILVVDNDKRLADITKEVLVNNNFDVEIANDGEEAIKKIYENNNFDLLLTDIRMPKKDGLEIIKILREDGNNMPIIAFSSDTNITTKETAIKLGVNEYISKPTEYNKIIDIIKTYDK